MESEVANCSREMYRPLLEGFTGEELARVQDTIATQFRRENEVRLKLKVAADQMACEQGSVILEYSARKGPSYWLLAKSIENLSQLLNIQQFHDTIAVRYGIRPSEAPAKCNCG
ncbi:hypothetical protein GJ496_001810 [Pomphorhynchus laevis]|nr:hypothetical protein GJ496_001810 [Pomphorhynchus laevis]